MTSTFYNDSDPGACEWLSRLCKRGLITKGDISRESIRYLSPETLAPYTRVHLFAGIGGWDYALRLAGWPDDREVWTGSCPCQPFSSAGKRKGIGDSRHLWPEMFRLIKARRPAVIFGEQVVSADVVGTQQEADFIDAVRAGEFGRANRLAKRLVANPNFSYCRRWLDGVFADLEGAGYACGALDLCAAGFGEAGYEAQWGWEDQETGEVRWDSMEAIVVGAPHIRQRLFWVAYAEHERTRSREPGVEGQPGGGRDRPAIDGGARGLSDSESGGRGERGDASLLRRGGHADGGDEALGLGIADLSSRERLGQHGGQALRIEAAGVHREPGGAHGPRGPWSEFDIIPFKDGKFRRAKPGLAVLAHGVPRRVELLRGYGNAIVPHAAAWFVTQCMEWMGIIKERLSAEGMPLFAGREA